MSITLKMQKLLVSIFVVARIASATITMMHPVELKSKFSHGIIESSLANFGHIDYGTSSMG